MSDIVKTWYEDSKNLNEMLSWNKGRLKSWESETTVQIKKGAKILDIGCGMGREAFFLSDMGYKVLGIDISSEIIDRVALLSKQHGYNIDFKLYDGHTLPFDNNSFDVVIIWSQTFGLLYGDKYKYEILSECRRVLNDNGLLSYSGHSYEYEMEHYPQYTIDGRFYPYANTELYWETFTLDSLTSFALHSGFKLLSSGEGAIYAPEDGIVLQCLCRKE